MKFLCVVLLFTCLVALSTALVQPTQPSTIIPNTPICQSNAECPVRCFCHKDYERQQRGQCACTMDLRALNECTGDWECKQRDSSGKPHSCSCRKDNSYQSKGQCECIEPLG